MALSGFCPGTVAAGVGEGRLDYLIPEAPGCTPARSSTALSYDRIMPPLTRWGRLGAVTIADVLHAEPWLVILVFAELALITFYLIERKGRPGASIGASNGVAAEGARAGKSGDGLHRRPPVELQLDRAGMRVAAKDRGHRIEERAMSDPSKKTDTQIQHDVSEELKWDTRVRATDVGVEVHSGVVTLTGTVDAWTERVAAQEAAHRVWGVHDVANSIKVKLPSSHVRDDTDIARAVRHALEWDVRVPDGRVRTTVEDGTVTLEGGVDFWSEYDDTERCVRNLAGVVHVRNLLNVEPASPNVGPLAVREAIERALERHAEHAASHVQIAIAAGKVVLSGAVPSWAELNAVVGAVRGTKGVEAVESRLRVGA